MKSCIACNAKMEDEFSFRKTCGTNQIERHDALINSNTTFLSILCVLTIVGSIFEIAIGWIYEFVSTMGDGEYFGGWIYIITNIGALVGAISMLKRDKAGLHLHTVSQSAYIFTVIYATIVFETSDFENFALVISMLFLVPYVIFLILYWQNMNVKHLKYTMRPFNKYLHPRGFNSAFLVVLLITISSCEIEGSFINNSQYTDLDVFVSGTLSGKPRSDLRVVLYETKEDAKEEVNAITSVLYTDNNGFVFFEDLEPGFRYWVRVDTTLIHNVKRSRVLKKGFNEMSITIL